MTRTRGNGEELTASGILWDARRAKSPTEFHEVSRDLSELIAREARAAFDQGMQLGAKVEHGVAVEAIATAALHVLGKDVGDGEINLGALGSWWPSFETAIGPKDQEGKVQR